MKLIDKSALVAEIDRLENKLYYEPENFKDVGAKMALDSLKSSLDTLEVKEVDWEKEIDDYMAREWEGIEEDKHFYDMIKNDLSDIAKHFYSLGLKAQKGE